jgi:hypothetical protein
MAESDAQRQSIDPDPENTVQESTTMGDHQPSESQYPSENPSQDAEKAEKPPTDPRTDPESYPEGGAKAWLTVAGASACLFVSFGWVNCIGVFQDYYQTHQLKEYSASDISWIPALQGS